MFESAKKRLEENSLDQQPLSDTYKQILEKYRKKAKEIESEAKILIEAEANIYTDRLVWMQALAICDVSLETNQVSASIIELYRQININMLNKHVSVSLNETDYHFWFNQVENIHRRFVEAKVYRAWAELADLYCNGRVGYRDLKKVDESLDQGMAKGDPASFGDAGYRLFYGDASVQADKEKGLKLIYKSKELGYEAADRTVLYLEFFENLNKLDNEKLLEKITSFHKNTTLKIKPYHILADYYFWKENNTEKGIEIAHQGIELGDHFCYYTLGSNLLDKDDSKDEAIKYLELASEYGIQYAANLLGQEYKNRNDIAQAIYWQERAAMYYFAPALYELAITYLYDDEHKDWELGMKYLEMAIDEKYPRALCQKAFILLEDETIERKPFEAKKLLEDAMEMGSDYAPYRLGLCYQDADFGGEPDYKKALELYELSAERGHLYGIEMAGHYYRISIVSDDEETNAPKAIKYLTQAVEAESDYGRTELALCYEVGYGVEQDYQKAFDLYKLAADNGYPFANQKMGDYYEDALLGSTDLTKAFDNFKIAADAGLPKSIYTIGRFYKYAVGIPENPEEAMNYFRKAAELGNPSGLVEVALAYEQEYAGIEFDAEKAMQYMTQAAEMDYTFALYKVGYYHYYGLIETDMEKGVEYFEKAYENGYPYAAIKLGEHYIYNRAGGEPDYEKALKYFEFAYEQGVITDGLGLCYEYGIGVEENQTEAFKYYTLAAEKGNILGMYRLALCYRNGTGTTKNPEDAFRWFSEAAADDHTASSYYLGLMYLNGEGVSLDEQKGVEYLLKAAEEDYEDAQFELGNCYLTGRGVAEDEVQAMVWYQKSAENGNEQAKKLTGKRDRKRR